MRLLEKSLDFAKEICLCVLKLDFCRIRVIKPYQSVFAPKTENMWRIIYYPGHQHDWNMRLISEKISVRFRCGVATG